MLRAPWRIALFILVAALVTGLARGLLYVASPVLHVVINPISTSLGGIEALNLLCDGLVMTVGLLVAHAVCLRRVDHLPWSVAGLDRTAARPALLARTALLGALAIGIPSAILTALGWMRLQPGPPGSSLAAAARALLILAPLAFVEELMIRGYLLAVLRKSLDWRVAVGVTSIVFGLLHIPNPGSNAENITMVVLAGVLLGTIVVMTGSLYAATATHLAWNWIMAGVLHVPVSGLGVEAPDYRLMEAGPDWLTGGAWGPEGGLGAALGMGSALAYLYVRRARPREE